METHEQRHVSRGLMARSAIGRVLAQFLVVVMTATMLVGGRAAPVDAASYDATKIDPAFLSEVLANPAGTFEVIVRSQPPAASFASKKDDRAARAAGAISRSGARPKQALGIVGGASARAKGEQILRLTREPEVDYVVKDAAFKVHFDPVADAGKVTTPGIIEVGAPSAWSKYGVTGKGVGVAVVDSGVFPHPDLAGRIAVSVDVTGPTTIVSSTPLGDPGGHGTHVAGLIAGNGAASGGAYTGVAPEATIVDVRAIDANGNSSTSTILRGLQWILANRATYNIRVANLSFGAPPAGSYRSDLMATAAEILQFANVAVVVAAGNGGGVSTITTPGTDPYVITVGALDDNETALLTDDLMAEFSSRGPTAYDNLPKPDLVAPGRRMVSLLAPTSTLASLYPERQVTAPNAAEPQYFRLSGTSMAVPVVTGTVALMLQRSPSLSPAQLKSRLKSTTTSLAFGTVNDRGAGLVNAANAVGSLSTTKEYSKGRVTDALAKDMRRFIQGQPITWRDLGYHGGVDSGNITWDNVTWENITWDNVTWENITWENFTWENVTWENITWENITWESVTWESTTNLSAGALSGTGSGWSLVN